MSTLQLIITDAGRQAIVDATNTGTLPIALSQVALGTGAWAPDATATALQSELKRVDTVGGLAVADDTLHVTVTDDSSDTYALGEFGLYTGNDVLFAIYSDPAGITDKTPDALLLLAADVILTSVPPGTVTVNGVGFSNPPATEYEPGIAEVATQSESDAGIDDARIVTPKKAKSSAAVYTYSADQSLSTPANTGTLAQLFSWIAGRIIGITGKSDWKTAPEITLEDASQHQNSTGDVHGATSTISANQLMLRDATGRAKIAAPSEYDDIARKDTVDYVQTNINAHAAQTSPHSATSSAAANRLMLRDASGRAKVAAPLAKDDIARKDTVDAAKSASGTTGEVSFFATSSAPSGWLKANGAVVSRSTYSELFSVIGTTFGAGDGATTFNLPDLRGEFVRGWDDSRGVDVGRTLGSVQAGSEVADHVNVAGQVIFKNAIKKSATTISAPGVSIYNRTSYYYELQPRNIALLACIKY